MPRYAGRGREAFQRYNSFMCDRLDNWMKREMKRNPHDPRIKAIVAGTTPDGTMTVEAWRAESAYEREHGPWWWRWSLQTIYPLHWWLERYGPLEAWDKLRAYHHRGRHGWAPRDTWSLDTYLSNVMAQSLKHLAMNTHSFPGELGEKEWERLLFDCANSLGNYGAIFDFPPEIHKQIEDEASAALRVLATHWGNIWD